MHYRLTIYKRAKKDLESLGPILQKRIARKLKFYINHEDPLAFATKLVDSKDGNFRWRIGHYRVVFDVKGNIIKLLRVQHRKDVYK